jgi:hypothetical protein
VDETSTTKTVREGETRLKISLIGEKIQRTERERERKRKRKIKREKRENDENYIGKVSGRGSLGLSSLPAPTRSCCRIFRAFRGRAFLRTKLANLIHVSGSSRGGITRDRTARILCHTSTLRSTPSSLKETHSTSTTNNKQHKFRFDFSFRLRVHAFFVLFYK